MAKKKLSAADAAWLKNQEQLEGRAPVPPGVLPGQIDMLDGSIAGSTEHVGMGRDAAHDILDSLPEPAPSRGPVAWPHIPDHCPECQRTMLIASGWATMKPREDRRLQCGNCGTIITVPQGAYDTLALAIKSHFEKLNYVPPKPDRGKKTRGAG